MIYTVLARKYNGVMIQRVGTFDHGFKRQKHLRIWKILKMVSLITALLIYG